jgi:hypothetical protein
MRKILPPAVELVPQDISDAMKKIKPSMNRMICSNEPKVPLKKSFTYILPWHLFLK